MATFTKRGNLQWQAKIRVKGHPPQSKTFNTKAEAEAWAKTIESEMIRGVFVSRAEAEQTTLQELLELYEQRITPTKRGMKQELNHLRMLKQQPEAQMFVATLTGKVISKLRDRRLAEVSPGTVNRELNILSHVFSTAAKEWHIHLPWGNPVMLIRRPKVNDKRERRLVADEEPRLLTTAKEDQGGCIYTITVLALETAMRRGEILSLTWDNIDLKRCTLHIPKTKTDTPRTVPLSSRAIEVLKSWPRHLNGKVFDITPESITRAFNRACQRAKIEDLRFHDLRHEAVSRMIDNGLTVIEVAAISGHKTIAMLQRYAHVRSKNSYPLFKWRKQSAIELMGTSIMTHKQSLALRPLRLRPP